MMHVLAILLIICKWEGSRPISLSLPLQTEAFSVHATRNFLRVYFPKDLSANVLLKKFMLIQMII